MSRRNSFVPWVDRMEDRLSLGRIGIIPNPITVPVYDPPVISMPSDPTVPVPPVTTPDDPPPPPEPSPGPFPGTDPPIVYPPPPLGGPVGPG